MRYKLNDSYLDLFKEQFSILCTKAYKLEMDVPSLKIVDEEYVLKDTDDSKSLYKTYEKFLTLEISDSNIILNGWKIAAHVRHVNSSFIPPKFGKLMNNAFYSFFEDVPEYKLQSNPFYCEHCNSTKDYVDFYILRNIETNEYKQVDAPCMEAFTNTKGISKLFQYVFNLESLFSDEKFLNENGTKFWYKTREILPYVMYVNNSYGWISKTESNQTGETPTREFVVEEMHASNVTQEYINSIQSEMDAIIEFHTKRLSKYHESGKIYGFKYESSKFTTDEYIDMVSKALSSLCFGVYEYYNTINGVYEVSEPIGEIGQRITVDAMLIYTKYANTPYGKSILCVTKEKNKNIIRFFISERSNSYEIANNMNKGDMLTITGVVKAHPYYNEVMSTELNRVELKLLENSD